MKFLIDKDVFQKEITNAVKFTSSQLSSLPSLQGVFIELVNKSFTLKSTNLNDFYQTTLPTESSDSFKAIFDAKKVLEFLNVLPQGKITISLKPSGLLILSPSLQGEFNLFQLDDYPAFPETDSQEEVVLTEEMVSTLPLVLFSSSRDDARPVLTGVLIESKDEVARFVTTDGFRLSVSNFTTDNANNWSFIASSRFLQELIVLYKGKELHLKYSKENKVFISKFGNTRLISRTIEGDFPPYQKVIPDKSTTNITLDVLKLSKNIKAVSIFARDQSNIIILDIQKNLLTIKPKGQKGESSYATQEIVSFDGEPIKIAFNYRFILDFLNIIPFEKITVGLTTSVSPVVFKEDSGDPNYLHIIMPLRTEEIEG